MRKSLLSSVRRLAISGLIAVLTLSIVGYFGAYFRYFELASHFKPQYFGVSVVFLLILLLVKAWRWSLAALVCVLLNAALVAYWFFPLSSDTAGRDVRILLANVNAGNTNYSAMFDLIAAEAPDIIIVQEAGDAWVEALARLGDSHPHSRFVPNRDNAGILLLSRFPLGPREEGSAESLNFPALFTRMTIKGLPVSLISIHPPPPITGDFLRTRNEQLTKVAALVKQLPQPVIVAGDLNTSLWSPYYSGFIRQSGLVNTRQGFGVLPTYPTHNRLMMIPIDHCLVTNDVKVTGCRIGREVGSDHLPLIVDLAFSNH